MTKICIDETQKKINSKKKDFFNLSNKISKVISYLSKNSVNNNSNHHKYKLYKASDLRYKI